MRNDTASAAFLEFGSVYKSMDPELRAQLVAQPKVLVARRFRSHFLKFDCDCYIEVKSGLGLLWVSLDPQSKSVQEFGMNGRIHIKPNVFFNMIPTSQELSVDLLLPAGYSMDVVSQSTPFEPRKVLPKIYVTDILGYFYRTRTQDHHVDREQHDFFELTFVDTGVLYTEVDGVTYCLGEKEMIIYGPGQSHTQYTSRDQSASYVNVMFRMMNLNESAMENWYDKLINKVFPYHKRAYSLIKTMIYESGTGIPYTDSLMNCLLTEIVVRLLQSDYVAPTAVTTSVVRQNYQDELFNRIVLYIDSKIYEPLTVAEICQQFSLSRSSLQLLFKNAVNQSPKKYISDLKLEKSCQLLRENKYTISEIAAKLGYSTIHYFSNAFNQKYHISPSEYAKRIY